MTELLCETPCACRRAVCHHEWMIDFEDACMDSPAGVALLAALEIRERTDVTWFERADDSLPAAVEAATRAVDTLTFGELCSVAVYAAQVVGPWTSGDRRRWRPPIAMPRRGDRSRRR